MRYVASLGGVILLLAFGTSAQIRPESSLSFASPFPALAAAVPSANAAFALPSATAEPLGAAAEPQGVYGVTQNFNFQAYAGFTYLRFYELPTTTGNLDGFNFSVVYYPHGGRLGVDGELVAVFAPQGGVNTTLVMAMGGARYRFPTNRGFEPWVHALGGGAHFSPQTPFGGQGALGVELGGGIDLIPRRSRLSYRVQADLVETFFFGTYQANPKVSIGIVYNF
ncbi:MAG: hypothetical protein ABSG27_05505 [Candidatus Acidiferrales bacterium]|jgi:hypothetical protein